MGFFEAFRTERYPTRYDDIKTAATVDVTEIIIITIFIFIVIGFVAVMPGIRGSERLVVFVRFIFSIFVTAVIIITNFGYGWESGVVETAVQYKSGTDKLINSTIGVWFGLRGVNITLKGNPVQQLGEVINYNERFSWEWTQGREGFGPYAGELQRQYREALYKGMPYPITWIVQYLTYDGDGLRFGRFYRTAGWYTHIFLWLALPLWILANVLLLMVIRYGAAFMLLTGLSMVIASAVYSCVRNPAPLVFMVRFQDEILKTELGWCFYLTLITGILCVVFSLLILFMDLRYPDKIATFFGIDVLQDYEEFYVDSPQNEVVVPHVMVTESEDRDDEKHRKENGKKEESDAVDQQHRIVVQQKSLPGLRKRTASVRFQKSHRRISVLESPVEQQQQQQQQQPSTSAENRRSVDVTTPTGSNTLLPHYENLSLHSRSLNQVGDGTTAEEELRENVV